MISPSLATKETTGGQLHGTPPWCTIVVPCYNEALRLPVDAFRVFLKDTPPIRFLFVNDGSTDATLAVLQALQSDFQDHVDLLDKQQNGGKGEAVRDGMRLACTQPGTRYVGFWDADLATPLDAISPMLQQLIAEPELRMVFGSRIRLLGRHVHRKASRHYLGRVFATVVSQMLRLPIYDTQCGAKIFCNTPEFASILAEPFLSSWVFDVELLARLKKLHADDPEYLFRSIYELPLNRWEDVAGSKVRAGAFLGAFVDVVRIYRRYLA